MATPLLPPLVWAGTYTPPISPLPPSDCSYTSALGMVLLPYLQYNGTATGGLLAPEDLQPLLDTPGAAAALAVFKSLLAFHIPLDLQVGGRVRQPVSACLVIGHTPRTPLAHP